jgi:hypothetical protein
MYKGYFIVCVRISSVIYNSLEKVSIIKELLNKYSLYDKFQKFYENTVKPYLDLMSYSLGNFKQKNSKNLLKIIIFSEYSFYD